MSTPEKHTNEKFEQFLRRWDAEVRSNQRTGEGAQKIAADFAKLGLSSAIFLNGGALVVLPTLMQWLNGNGRSLVAVTAVWFPIGIVLSVLATLLTYTNFTLIHQYWYIEAHKRAHELSSEYTGKQLENDSQYQRSVGQSNFYKAAANVTGAMAILLVVGSFIAFGIGVFGFINLASYNTIPR